MGAELHRGLEILNLCSATKLHILGDLWHLEAKSAKKNYRGERGGSPLLPDTPHFLGLPALTQPLAP